MDTNLWFFVNQYHFGSNQNLQASVSGLPDYMFAYRGNMTVYHISSTFVYRMPAGNIPLAPTTPLPFMQKDEFCKNIISSIKHYLYSVLPVLVLIFLTGCYVIY